MVIPRSFSRSIESRTWSTAFFASMVPVRDRSRTAFVTRSPDSPLFERRAGLGGPTPLVRQGRPAARPRAVARREDVQRDANLAGAAGLRSRQELYISLYMRVLGGIVVLFSRTAVKPRWALGPMVTLEPMMQSRRTAPGPTTTLSQRIAPSIWAPAPMVQFAP